MTSALSKYLNQLMTNDPIPGDVNHYRWVCRNKKFSCIQKSKIPAFSIVKIETVLSRLNKDLKRFDTLKVDKGAAQDLEKFIGMVRKKTDAYKNKHGAFYRFLSRLLYGDIDIISKNLINHLDRLRLSFRPPLDNQPDLKDDFPPFNVEDFIDFFPEDQFAQNLPVQPPKKNKPDSKKPVQPAKKIDEEVLLKPPVYGPYIAPAPDEETKLENHIKSNRLKFYEFFSQKIQIPEDPDEPLRLPFISINSKELAIHLPDKVKTDFVKWLENELAARNIVYQVKNEMFRQVGALYTKVFKFTLEEADKLIQTFDNNIGLMNLTQLIRKDKPLEICHCITSEPWGHIPQIENTISLSLSQLDSGLLPIDSNLKSHPQPHSKIDVPIVQFDEKGMTIKIPESRPLLTKLLTQVFGLPGKGGDDVAETHFERKYNYVFQIQREEIESFIKQLGLDKIPSEGLHERYKQGDITYLQHLIETHRYHPYKPVRKNEKGEVLEPLDAIRESLAALVPNEMGIRPYVSYHPRGWLSIKLPDWSPDYPRLLATYLKREPIQINEEINGITYVNEIIYYDDGKLVDEASKKKEIEELFKTLKLENFPEEKTSYIELFRKYNYESLEELYAETEGDLDLARTIGRRLTALEPKSKESLMAYTPEMYPEFANIDLVAVEYDSDKFEIKVPKSLHDRLIPVSSTKSLHFCEYLSSIFGISGHLKKIDHNEIYSIEISPDKIKSFLEKDLGLRLLPKNYKKSDTATFFNHFCHDISLKNKKSKWGRFKPHASLENLSLHNPPVPIPNNVPQKTEKEIFDVVYTIMAKHPQKETCEAVIKDTLNRISPGKENPDLAAYRDDIPTANAIRLYLNAVMHELATNEKLTEDKQRSALIEITEGCKDNTCLPGRLTKIQNVYQQLINPIFEDQVRYVLLDKIEEFKNQLLATFWGKLDHGVHAVNMAKIFWSKEFGLNKVAAELDAEIEKQIKDLGCEAYQRVHGYRVSRKTLSKAPKHIQAAVMELGYEALKNEFHDLDLYKGSEKRMQFLQECHKNLKDEVFRAVRDSRDEKGTIFNILDFQQRAKKILREEGLKALEIDNEIERLFPTLQYLKNQVIKEKLIFHLRNKLDNQGFKPVEIEEKVKPLTQDLNRLREQFTEDELKKIEKEEEPKIEEQIKPLRPDLNTYQKYLNRKFNDILKLRLRNKLDKQGLKPEEVEAKVKLLARDPVELRKQFTEDELKKLEDKIENEKKSFIENIDQTQTITKEAVEMLLIDIGVLNA